MKLSALVILLFIYGPFLAQVPTQCDTTISFSFVLFHQYPSTDSVIFLNGSPSGGAYYGYGVKDNKFLIDSLPTNDYNITYVYVDSLGCTYVDCATTKIIQIATDIYIPTSYTPSSDTAHVFQPIHPSYTRISFTIYNRWGEKIFQTSEQDAGWDGTVDGRDAPMGIYVWLLEVMKDNDTITQSGTVALLR